MGFLISTLLVFSALAASYQWAQLRARYVVTGPDMSAGALGQMDRSLARWGFAARLFSFSAMIPIAIQYSPFAVDAVWRGQAAVGMTVAAGMLLAISRTALKVPLKSWWLRPLQPSLQIGLSLMGFFLTSILALFLAVALDPSFRTAILNIRFGK
ncbi:MAG: hypothetical protein WEE89_15985 [Gemmatimonadota bacterium]